jgi:hypothetical protein
MEHNQEILGQVIAIIKQDGKKVDHGCGHVVKEYVSPHTGAKYELEVGDFGNGRKIWKDGILIGTID